MNVFPHMMQLLVASSLLEMVELLFEVLLVAIEDPVCAQEGDDKTFVNLKNNENIYKF